MDAQRAGLRRSERQPLHTWRARRVSTRPVSASGCLDAARHTSDTQRRRVRVSRDEKMRIVSSTSSLLKGPLSARLPPTPAATACELRGALRCGRACVSALFACRRGVSACRRGALGKQAPAAHHNIKDQMPHAQRARRAQSASCSSARVRPSRGCPCAPSLRGAWSPQRPSAPPRRAQPRRRRAQSAGRRRPALRAPYPSQRRLREAAWLPARAADAQQQQTRLWSGGASEAGPPAS